MTERTLPDGFHLKAVETDAAGFKYPVEVPQSDSLTAILEAYEKEGKNGEEILRDLWNSGNEQGAKQGPKGPVRDAVAALAADPENPDLLKARDEAVVKAQEAARTFIQGAPRGGGGARHPSKLTKAQRTELGSKVGMIFATTGKAPTQAQMLEICEEMEIDPAALAELA